MEQVNTTDGYVAIRKTPEGNRTIGIYNMAEEAGAGIEATRDNIINIRAMLWDAIRKQERGFDISIDDVLRIEDVRHKRQYSIPGYVGEIEWTIGILQSHLRRIAAWKDASEAEREMYGKLGEFLSQFEEM